MVGSLSACQRQTPAPAPNSYSRRGSSRPIHALARLPGSKSTDPGLLGRARQPGNDRNAILRLMPPGRLTRRHDAIP